MTVREAIARAVDCHDPRAAAAVSDTLRGRGLNYQEQFSLVQRERPNVTLAEWDELLQEADSE